MLNFPDLDPTVWLSSLFMSYEEVCISPNFDAALHANIWFIRNFGIKLCFGVKFYSGPLSQVMYICREYALLPQLRAFWGFIFLLRKFGRHSNASSMVFFVRFRNIHPPVASSPKMSEALLLFGAV